MEIKKEVKMKDLVKQWMLTTLLLGRACKGLSRTKWLTRRHHR